MNLHLGTLLSYTRNDGDVRCGLVIEYHGVLVKVWWPHGFGVGSYVDHELLRTLATDCLFKDVEYTHP